MQWKSCCLYVMSGAIIQLILYMYISYTVPMHPPSNKNENGCSTTRSLCNVAPRSSFYIAECFRDDIVRTTDDRMMAYSASINRIMFF